MAAAKRPRVATYVIHESHELPTDDHEDHHFCGIMFDVGVKVPSHPKIPVDYLEISALAVRGNLGPMQVFYTPDSYTDKHENPSAWTKCYEGFQSSSPNEYRSLEFREPLRLKPGDSCGLYVHSSAPGDDAVVYDEQGEFPCSREDLYVRVLPGMAHLSNKPFGRRGPWGTGWRRNREFVGRVFYGVRWLLWNPEVNDNFPPEFQRTVNLMCWAIHQPDASISVLPQDVVLYIMNMCRWDWSPLSNPLPMFKQETSRPRDRFRLGFFHWGFNASVNDDDDDDNDDDDEDDEDDMYTGAYQELNGGEDPMVESSTPLSDAHDAEADHLQGSCTSDQENESDGGDAQSEKSLNEWETTARQMVCERWGGEECN